MSKHQVMPPLSKKQYDALEKSIVEDGVIMPILVDERGDVIDGHHRQEIADKHKIAYQTQVVKGITDAQASIMAIKVNVLRRNLPDHQWGQIFMELVEAGAGTKLPASAVENSKETITDKQCAKVAHCQPDIDSLRFAAKITGIPESTARRRVKAAQDFEMLPPSQKRAVEKGKKTVKQAVKEESVKAIQEEKTVDVLEQAKNLNTPLTDVMSLIQKIRATVKSQTSNPHLRHQPFDRAMKDAWEIIKFALPHSLCPYCAGDGCKLCQQLGWMPKDIFDRVPAKDKK